MLPCDGKKSRDTRSWKMPDGLFQLERRMMNRTMRTKRFGDRTTIMTMTVKVPMEVDTHIQTNQWASTR